VTKETRVAKLRLSDDLELPLEAVTETFAIIAKRRVGKSNAAVVMAEEMYDAGIPWAAIDPKGDWWGVRSSADGKHDGLSVVVFGGEHGDVPLEPSEAAGRYMADLLANERLTCVLDVSHFSKAEEIRFLLAFASRLLRVNKHPLHLFLEECDDYIPQNLASDETHLVRAFSRLIRHGGFKGIGSTLITQRAALVNKNVLSQTETMIVLRTTHPPDQEVVAKWIKGHPIAAELVASMQTLKPGDAWVVSPAFLELVQRTQFRRRRTFDSGATPKMGEARVEPTRLADVDLAVIKEAMQETIDKAKADDPKELKRRIAELEGQVADLEQRPAEPAEPEVVEFPVLRDDLVAELRSTIEQAQHLAGGVEAALGHWVNMEDRRLEASATKVAPTGSGASRGGKASRPESGVASAPVSPAARPPRPASPPRDGEVRLKAGAKRMVHSLALFHPRPLTRLQLSVLSDVKYGGTFSDYLRSIVDAGLALEDAGIVSATAAGVDFAAMAGYRVGAGVSTDEILAIYRPKLKAGARRMLDLLVGSHPDGYTRRELSELAEVSYGGTFTDYLRSLVRPGLAEERSGVVYAGETLYLGSR
jgi:hypothetical protein